MPNLTDFLLDRITEDEASAGNWLRFEIRDGVPGNYAIPERVLAECEAKRRIVDRWKDLAYEVERAEMIGDYDAAPVATAFAYGQVIAELATVYADHPDFDESWRL